MDESMVLSEGQKKVRFRKSLEKKSSTSMMAAVSARPPFQQVDDSVDDISRNHTANAQQPTEHLYRQLGKYIKMFKSVPLRNICIIKANIGNKFEFFHS